MMKSRYILAILLGLCFGSCSNHQKELDGKYDKQLLDQEQLRDVVMYYSDSAMIKLKVKSKKLIRYTNISGPKDEFPDGLKAEFINAKKQVVSRMDGGYAMRDDKTGEIVIRDNVVCVNRNQDKLYTTELFWNERSEKLYTKKFVKITRPIQGDTIMGYGLIANQDFTRFELENRVSASLTSDEIAKVLK